MKRALLWVLLDAPGVVLGGVMVVLAGVVWLVVAGVVGLIVGISSLLDRAFGTVPKVAE